MVPAETRQVMGREEHTSLYPAHDLAISFRFDEAECVVGIVDVRTVADDARRG